MSNEKELPSEEIQRITPAPEGMRNCTVCGLWLDNGTTHDHEKDND